MKSVLIVEDDKDILWVYNEVLKEEGIKVKTADNAKSALNQLNKHSPGLILLDIMFPGEINGLELLKILKKDKKTAHIPVIMLTNLDGTQKLARKLGCADYVLKVDTSLDTLVQKVKKYL